MIKCGENLTYVITGWAILNICLVGGKAVQINSKKMVKLLTHVKDYKINTFFKDIQILPFGSAALNGKDGFF
jgi:hypothetical protein